MLFCVMHLDDQPAEDEEVYLVVPDGSKVAIAVPLDALPAALPILKRACGERAPPACPSCAAELPVGISKADHNVDTMGM